MSKTNPKIIGVCGLARSGKNTFADLLQSIDNHVFIQDAFANRLKRGLESLAGQQLGWDIFNLTDEQKLLIRPIMVEWGRMWRKIDINHWVKEVDNKYDFTNDKTGTVLIITDFRYVNEVNYFKEKYGDNFLMVDIVREGVEPPNEEESINYPIVSALADVKIAWPTVGKDNLGELRQYAADFYNIYFN